MQRMMLRTTHSHICGRFRVFLATPVNKAPERKGGTRAWRKGAVSLNLGTSPVQRKKLLTWKQFGLLRNNTNAKGLLGVAKATEFTGLCLPLKARPGSSGGGRFQESQSTDGDTKMGWGFWRGKMSGLTKNRNQLYPVTSVCYFVLIRVQTSEGKINTGAKKALCHNRKDTREWELGRLDLSHLKNLQSLKECNNSCPVYFSVCLQC